MRELSFIISNLIELMRSQNATKKQIKAACGEIIDAMEFTNPVCIQEHDIVDLKSYPASYCPKCGFIFPF